MPGKLPALARENSSLPPGADAAAVRRKQAQAEAFAPDTALRVRPGVGSRGYRISSPPPPADDLESCTPPGALSGDAWTAALANHDVGDEAQPAAAPRSLQGRAQQTALLCWMHGAIGYGYFVMQARERRTRCFGDELRPCGPSLVGLHLSAPE